MNHVRSGYAIVLMAILFQGCSSPASNAGSSAAPAVNAERSTADKKKNRDSGYDGEGRTSISQAELPGCDKSLWGRVYNPERLEVLDQCKTVTGTVAERNVDDDGDEHMLLKLDPGQEELLTKRNLKKKDGDLVIEAVCVNPPNRKKVGNTCDGFRNTVDLPNIGDHIRVTGSYVTDGHNGWTEIHPISRVETVP